MDLEPQINRFATGNELGAALTARIARLAEQASCGRGRFYLAISGGSLMDAICPSLTSIPLRDAIRWSDWHVFWADERWVQWSSPESNYGAARQKLFSAVGIPETQIHAADTTLLRPSETAWRYQATMVKVLQPQPGELPRFDLILLGLGEDGHTASLFPDHPLLEETGRWVVPVHDAPKPPPIRITMTLPVINNARNVFFVATGTKKAAIVARILGPGDPGPKLPAQRVRPSNGELAWFVSDGGFGQSSPE
jgi:6-phosphogluconolactonase